MKSWSDFCWNYAEWCFLFLLLTLLMAVTDSGQSVTFLAYSALLLACFAFLLALAAFGLDWLAGSDTAQSASALRRPGSRPAVSADAASSRQGLDILCLLYTSDAADE